MNVPSDPIDNILLHLFARVVYHWGYVEHLQTEWLAHLIQANKGFAYVITKGISGATVTDWIRTVSKVRYASENQEALTELLARIDNTRAERNALVHGLWHRGPEHATAMIQTVRWQRAELIKDELVTEGDLSHLLEEIIEIFDALRRIGTAQGFFR